MYMNIVHEHGFRRSVNTGTLLNDSQFHTTTTTKKKEEEMVMITLTGSRVENFGFYLELGNKFAVLRWLVAGRTRAPLAVGSLTRRRSSLTLTSV